MPVSFVNQYGSVVFSRAPQPAPGSSAILQQLRESGGGYPVVSTSIGSESSLTLVWNGMPEAELLNLITFQQAAALGMAREFVYNDATDMTSVVRFATAELTYTDKSYGRFNVTVSLLRNQEAV